jgi:UDP-N-acetylglucosamine--N-acetylmuramyl-(pentapeptide) pyrophosphoryl-undecaprenol N-acetylglucosamine transferase
LIPYPFATGDHQTLNAREFESSGAAVLIPEAQIGERLLVTLKYLFSDSNKRQQMAAASRKLARPDAAAKIAQTILEKINEI